MRKLTTSIRTSKHQNQIIPARDPKQAAGVCPSAHQVPERQAAKKEGNTGNIRKVYSSGDGESHAPVMQSKVEANVETKAVRPHDEVETADFDDINGKA